MVRIRFSVMVGNLLCTRIYAGGLNCHTPIACRYMQRDRRVRLHILVLIPVFRPMHVEGGLAT